MRTFSKKSIFIAIPFVILLLSSFMVVEPKSVHVIMNQGQIMLKIQDTKSDSAFLTPEWYTTAFTKLFGDFDRNTNSVYTYDNLGLNVWKDGSGLKVSEFHVNLTIDKNDAADNSDYNPKNTFTGNFTIDGIKITSNILPGKLKDQLANRGWKIETCSLAHNYKVTKKGIYIYFQYNEAESAIEFAAIGLRHF